MRMGWSSLYTLTKLAYKTHSPEWAITHTHIHIYICTNTHTYTHTKEKQQIHFYSCVTYVKNFCFFTVAVLNFTQILLSLSILYELYRDHFYNYSCNIFLSLVAGGRVGKKKAWCATIYRFSCPSTLGRLSGCQLQVPRGVLVQNLHQQFTLSSALQYLLTLSAFHIRLPQLLQIIITSSPRRAEAK